MLDPEIPITGQKLRNSPINVLSLTAPVFTESCPASATIFSVLSGAKSKTKQSVFIFPPILAGDCTRKIVCKYELADVEDEPDNINTAVHAGTVTPVVSLLQESVIVRVSSGLSVIASFSFFKAS